ncbi:MAG: TonB-dependent receptor [Candidatus Marinimicrobia bacterium]|nr:TonB-dependent receptor [Candidatus Neomarinimicrobiota bacterium]
MMKRILFFVFAVMILLPTFVFSASAGKISGIVKDAKTGEPLAGVNVTLVNTEMGAATDVDGYFAILNVPVGKYDLRASIISHKAMVIKGLRASGGVTTEANFDLEETVIEGEEVVVIAKRKLFQKDATSSVSIVTSEDLENTPIRGTTDILDNMAGIVVQDGAVHIRAGRGDETAYYINGVSASDPASNARATHVIDEAVEEIQALAGGYTADMGGASAGVVKMELKAGGSKLHGSIDARTDGFRDPADGEKKLDTYNYGHNLITATLGGPLGSNKIKFFVAGEMNNREDAEVRFSEGFTFEDRVDMNPYSPDVIAGTPDSVKLMNYADGFTPNQNDDYYAINGTIMLDLPIKLKLGGMYTNREYVSDGTPMLSLLNERTYGYKTETMMLTGKATKFFSSKTYLELRGSYYKYNRESNDSWFGNEWEKYMDSTAVADYTLEEFDSAGVVNYRSRWLPERDYLLNGFVFERDGNPTNFYSKRETEFFEIAGDFATQYGKHHELKLGGSFKGSTMRYFDINPYVMSYVDPDSGMEAMDPTRWIMDGGVDVYGYDIYGKEEIDEDTDYGDAGIYAQAPKKPMQAAGYLMDKIEYNDLVINAGIRFEYFDSDDKVLNNPGNPGVDQNSGTILDTAWTDKDPVMEVSPRIGFSFPVSDRTGFYFQYGKYIQMPNLNNAYTSNYAYNRQIVAQGYYFKNPVGFDLEPIRTVSYEVGFRQQLSESSALDVTAFYKNEQGLVQAIEQDPSTPSVIDGPYFRYANGDFVTTKGLEIRYILRKTERLSAQVNYTLTLGEGTASNSAAATGALDQDSQLPTTINPLSFSQKHKGSINLDYRFGDKDGGALLQNLGANLLFKFASGHPYTKVIDVGGQAGAYDAGVNYMDDSRSRVAIEPVGASTTPWTFTTDLKLDKSLNIGGLRTTFYAIVNNVFNRQNVINVYQMTGSATDDGYVGNTDAYKANASANGGEEYTDMYEAINIVNGQAYWSELGKQLYSDPRQIFFGVKISF